MPAKASPLCPYITLEGPLTDLEMEAATKS